MTRKNYVEVAKLIALAKVSFDKETVEYFEQELAGLFAADNPRFDRERFYKACMEEV